MTPFFHPTSMLALDDDPLFLESLDFQFSEDVSCQTFTRPDAALEHLINQAGQHPSCGRMYDVVAAPTDGLRMGMRNPSDPLLCANVSGLRAIIDDPGREMRVSVAVIDYDMPEMNGLDFCRAIRNLPVKKILLTGTGRLEVAVEAFNDGLIDCFLQKQDENAASALRSAIHRLQRSYFAAVSRPIANVLALGDSWFTDPAVQTLIESTIEENGMVEYCISTMPPGVVLRDSHGNETFMLIADRRSVDVQIAAAAARGAPDELLRQLASGTSQSWFPTRDGLYTDAYFHKWPLYTWAAAELHGDGHWLHSSIPANEAGASEAVKIIA